MKSIPVRSAGSLSLLAVLVCACAGDEAPITPVVRDSAGITIVENAPGAEARVPRWTVAPEPELRIGVVEGDPAYMFSDLTDGLRLSDGTVVALDGGEGRVAFYDAAGRHLESQGRRGGGPGEYESPEALFRIPGDTVGVFDRNGTRVTFLSSTGELLRTSSPPGAPGSFGFAGALSDGRIVLTRQVLRPVQTMTPLELTFWIFDPGRAALDSVGRAPWSVRGFFPVDEAGTRWIFLDPVFSSETVVAAAGDVIVIGTATAHEVRLLGPDGEPRRVVRWQGPSLEVTAADRAAYEAWLFRDRPELTPEARRAARRGLELRGFASSAAAYDEILPDNAGRLWIRASSRGADDPATFRQWTVLDPDGRLIATAALPQEFAPFEIGEEWILGAVQDELGIQSLVLYRLRS